MRPDVPHRIRTLDSHDQQEFDWVAPPQTASRGLVRLVYIFAALVLAVTIAVWAYATPANAIPGSTQNPDGSWTGPNGEDLGGGNQKPEPARPASNGSDGQDGPSYRQCCIKPDGRLRVIIGPNGDAASAKNACQRVIAPKRCDIRP